MYATCFFDLLFYQARANLRSEISRLYLNFAWWVIEPCMTMLIYYVVFGLFMKHTTEHFMLFLLIGTTQWQWFAATTMHAVPCIQAANELIQHVDIPKIIFPLEVFIRDSYKHIFVLILMSLFLLAYPIPKTISWLALPLLFALQAMVVLTSALTVAALCPLLPDLQYIVTTAMNVLVFVSGVFFDMDRFVLPQHQFLLYLNPMAGLLREYRRVIIGGHWPDWTYLGALFLCVSSVLFSVVLLLRRLDRVYPRICQE